MTAVARHAVVVQSSCSSNRIGMMHRLVGRTLYAYAYMHACMPMYGMHVYYKELTYVPYSTKFKVL